MTTKKKTPAVPKPDKAKQTHYSKLVTSASVMSAAASEDFASSMFPEVNLSFLIDELSSKIKIVQAGDMAAMEAMLVGQAHALQTIFASLARRATKQEYLKNYGMFMNLALKAQSQSRATIQALTELKYPKQVAFVKQANISHGHQQVNNATNTHAPAHAKEITNQSNELLREMNNATLDTSGTATTS